MEYREALAYLDGARWNGAEPSLRRIRELLAALGDPQKELKFVHIAGTNGKGSCAAMLASVLRAAGYRTGLYTSPYLYRFSERMQINGEQIPDEMLTRCVESVREKAEKMEDHPTEFELITAAALLWFLRENCGIVVLEAGLGGRFDATNAIDAPECSIIMNIGLDHTRILGDTVEKIAAEKAGIIKAGVPCVVYGQTGSRDRFGIRQSRGTGLFLPGKAVCAFAAGRASAPQRRRRDRSGEVSARQRLADRTGRAGARSVRRRLARPL